MKTKHWLILLLACVSIGAAGLLLIPVRSPQVKGSVQVLDRSANVLPQAVKPERSSAQQLAFPDSDAQVTVTEPFTSSLPENIPTILLTDKPIEPSPLTGGVWNLPYVPPSPDTKPEFEIKPAPKSDTNAGSSAPPAAPALVLGTMPTPTLTFNALDFSTNGAGHPPDTNGDVGLDHYMESVNTSIGIYTKTTGAKATAFTFNSFWSGAGTGTACDTGGSLNGPSNQGDPIVLFDTIGQRWIFMDFAWKAADLLNGPYFYCFGVSQTSNPLGNYWRYAIRADDAVHPWLPDYPKGGVWRDGLYFSANMFDCLVANCDSATYKGARVYAYNLQKMEAGLALTPNDVQAKDTTSSFFTLMPSNVRGTLPPANTPNYFVSEDKLGYFWDVFKFHVDFTTPVNSTFTGPTQVNQASYATAADPVPQPFPGNDTDTLADRMMFLNQYRNIGSVESLWVQHTTGTASASTPTGIQWAQINVTGGTINTTPVQQQIFHNGADGLNRFMGSLAVDKQGNAALGYTASSSSVAPDIRYVGRLKTDPLNQMPQTETTLLPSVTRSVQTGSTRWGDYSAMTVDPVDDCTFWYTNMYFPVQGTNWVTRIGKFKFPSCLVNILPALEASTKTVNVSIASRGAPVTYTIFLRNTIGTDVNNVLITDTLPLTITYKPNSLNAPSGTFGYASGIITWTGSVNAGGTVTVTFGATVNQTAPLGGGIVNSVSIDSGGEIITRTATINIPLAHVFLPLVLRNYCSIGICGRVTLNGAPAAGVPLDLRFYNGSSWSTRASTTTAADGGYSFTSAPSLVAGQKYYVRFMNPAATADGRLFKWSTRYLTSYTAGSTVPIGYFDLADIPLVSPTTGATVSLPNMFQWTRRTATPTDSYEFNLFDSNSSAFFYTDPPLGYVSSYALNSLPGGFSVGISYGWFVAAYSSDGGYGESFYYNVVKFSNTGMSVTAVWQPLQSKTVQDVEYRHKR